MVTRVAQRRDHHERTPCLPGRLDQSLVRYAGAKHGIDRDRIRSPKFGGVCFERLPPWLVDVVLTLRERQPRAEVFYHVDKLQARAKAHRKRGGDGGGPPRTVREIGSAGDGH